MAAEGLMGLIAHSHAWQLKSGAQVGLLSEVSTYVLSMQLALEGWVLEGSIPVLCVVKPSCEL